MSIIFDNSDKAYSPYNFEDFKTIIIKIEVIN